MILQDGKYRWRCEVDEEYERAAFRNTMGICAGTCALLVLVSLLSGAEMVMIISSLFGSAVIMLIAFGMCRWILFRPGHLVMPFEMTEEYVLVGRGKGSRYTAFKNVVRAEASGNKIRLYSKYSKAILYVPKEEFEQVWAFVRGHVKGAEESRED